MYCTVYRQVQQRIQITISLTFLKTWCLILPRNIFNCCRGGEDGLHGPGEVEGQGHQHRGRGLPDTGAQETEHSTPALLPTGIVPEIQETEHSTPALLPTGKV